jgi:hypothetical protein
MSLSVLNTGHLETTTEAIVDDRWLQVEVWRGEVGSEQRIAQFRTRIAATSAAVVGRDVQELAGDVSPQFYVMPFVAGHGLQAGDEVWSGNDRYRVVAVDAFSHQSQAIMQRLQ